MFNMILHFLSDPSTVGKTTTLCSQFRGLFPGLDIFVAGTAEIESSAEI